MQFEREPKSVTIERSDGKHVSLTRWVAEGGCCEINAIPSGVRINVAVGCARPGPRCHFVLYVARGMEGFVVRTLLDTLRTVDSAQAAILTAVNNYVAEICSKSDFEAEPHAVVGCVSKEDIRRYMKNHATH